MVAPFVALVQQKGGACEYTGEAGADEKRGEGDSEKNRTDDRAIGKI